MTLFLSPFAPRLRATRGIALGAALSAALLLAACATVPATAPEPASTQPRLKMTPALETVFNAEEAQLLNWSAIALNQCRVVFNQAVQARRLYDWYASL